jgi:hypothetical protein
VRIGPDTYPLRPGDVVASSPGGPEVAHQIINTGTELGPGPEGKPQIFASSAARARAWITGTASDAAAQWVWKIA